MEILLLVSLFAAMLAFHNSATRYLYSLGRARMLPHALARTRFDGTPQIAGLVQASFAAIVALLFFIAGLDPILNLVPAMLGFGTLAVLVLQGLAALAIIVHFRRTRDPRLVVDLHRPGHRIPRESATITVLAIVNFDIVAGSSRPADPAHAPFAGRGHSSAASSTAPT